MWHPCSDHRNNTGKRSRWGGRSQPTRASATVSFHKKHQGVRLRVVMLTSLPRKKEIGGNYYPTADSRLEGEDR